jgi:hypothetical protein
MPVLNREQPANQIDFPTGNFRVTNRARIGQQINFVKQRFPPARVNLNAHDGLAILELQLGDR